jgi:hypothetical protein
MLALLGCACVRQSPRKINSKLTAGRHTPAAAEPRGGELPRIPAAQRAAHPDQGVEKPHPLTLYIRKRATYDQDKLPVYHIPTREKRTRVLSIE